MKFDELDAKMRVFETAHDHCVLPGIHIVVRLDGRSFTKLTKETLPQKISQMAAPFDQFVNSVMVATVSHLMQQAGLRVIFGFTQSDEISLLLHPSDTLFGRKERKLNSVLAGEASACATHLFGEHAVFDSRVCQLPTNQLVVDYFRWRQEDAGRNALSSHCYYTLLREGLTAKEATAQLKGLDTSAKNELLFKYGINFNTLPTWHKRGVGLYWDEQPITGFNPHKQEETRTTRRVLVTNRELPMRHEYDEFLSQLLSEELHAGSEQ